MQEGNIEYKDIKEKNEENKEKVENEKSSEDECFLKDIIIAETSSNRDIFINVNDINYIYAKDKSNYINVKNENEDFLVKKTLEYFCDIKNKLFFKTSKDVVVNALEIYELEYLNYDEHKLILKNGKDFKISKQYYSEFRKMFYNSKPKTKNK